MRQTVQKPQGQSNYPKAFPLYVRLWGSTTEKHAAEGLPEENPKEGFILSLGTVWDKRHTTGQR